MAAMKVMGRDRSFDIYAQDQEGAVHLVHRSHHETHHPQYLPYDRSYSPRTYQPYHLDYSSPSYLPIDPEPRYIPALTQDPHYFRIPHQYSSQILSHPSVLPHTSHSVHHPYTPARPLHDFGGGPTPLFGWDSVVPLSHTYGQQRYTRHVKPDYRRFCFSVGKADVPYAALPGGPLWGYPTTMSPQLVGRW